MVDFFRRASSRRSRATTPPFRCPTSSRVRYRVCAVHSHPFRHRFCSFARVASPSALSHFVVIQPPVHVFSSACSEICMFPHFICLPPTHPVFFHPSTSTPSPFFKQYALAGQEVQFAANLRASVLTVTPDSSVGRTVSGQLSASAITGGSNKA